MTSDTEWPLQSGAGSTGFGATVWIVGAKGFLGRHIARRFGADGYRVIGIGRSEWDADQCRPWGVGAWSAAGIEPAALNSLFDQFGRPDLVVHAAGSASIGRSLDEPFADFFDFLDRALAREHSGVLYWFWIGPHDEYERILKG